MSKVLIGVHGCALLLVLGACSSSDPPASGASTPAASAGQIGNACPKGAGDCASGLQCASEDPGGGQCEKPCSPSKDSDCGDTTKYACSSEGHCYVKCTSVSDCKRASEGYVCKDDTPARGVKFCDAPD